MSKDYIIIPLKNKGSYGVRITEPNSFPDTVSGFDTRAQAEAWIAKQKAADAAAERGGQSVTKPE